MPNYPTLFENIKKKNNRILSLLLPVQDFIENLSNSHFIWANVVERLQANKRPNNKAVKKLGYFEDAEALNNDCFHYQLISQFMFEQLNTEFY